MAITRVQATVQSTGGPSGPWTLPAFAAPPTVGNGIIVLLDGWYGQSVISVADNYGNAYASAGRNGGAAIWYCPRITATGAAFTITVNYTATEYFVGSAIEVTGVGAGLGLEHAVAASGSGTTITVGPTASLSGPDAFVVATWNGSTNQSAITVESVSPPWVQEHESLTNAYNVTEGDSRALSGSTGLTASCTWTLSSFTAYQARLAAFSAVPRPSVAAVLGERNAGTTSSITLNNVTTPVGSSRRLAVLVVHGTTNTLTVTHGGTALTKTAAHDFGDGATVDLWERDAPPVGSAHVVITGSTTGELAAVAYSLNDCGALSGLTGTTGSSTTPSLTVSSVANALVIDLCSSSTANQQFTVGAGQTSYLEQETHGDSSARIGSSTEPGAASVTLSWTLATTGAWRLAALSVSAPLTAPAVTGTASAGRLVGTGPLTFAHTSTGDPLYLAAGYSTGALITTVTYGGVALEQLGRVTGSGHILDWWYLATPVAGTANLVITLTAASNVGAIARNVSGGDPDAAFRNLTSAIGTSTTPSVVVTSAVGDLVLDLVTSDGPSQAFTVGAGQTLDAKQDGFATGNKSAASHEAGAASVTMSWTLSVSDAWLTSGLSIPAAGTIAALDGRVTQSVVETLSLPTPPARLSQTVVEVLGAAAAVPVPGRLTQLVIETLTEGAVTSPGQVTQLLVETLQQTPPVPVRVTHLAVDVFRLSPPAPARATQLALEVFHPHLIPLRTTQLAVEEFHTKAAATRTTQVAVEVFIYPPVCIEGELPIDVAPEGGSCRTTLLP